MNGRKLGNFRVPLGLVQTIPDRVAQLFALLEVVPVRAGVIYAYNAIEYTAIAPGFAFVPESVVASDYVIVVTNDEPLEAHFEVYNYQRQTNDLQSRAAVWCEQARERSRNEASHERS